MESRVNISQYKMMNNNLTNLKFLHIVIINEANRLVQP